LLQLQSLAVSLGASTRLAHLVDGLFQDLVGNRDGGLDHGATIRELRCCHQ
jgi:hypothetical protein